MANPYIVRESNGDVLIVGEPEELKALGEMLVLKSKMKENFSATLQDSEGSKIVVCTGKELEDSMEQLKS